MLILKAIDGCLCKNRRVEIQQVIPILRIFDYSKAIEFYVDWLGFRVEWEHRFEENTPVYIGVRMNNCLLHLSEHHGDGTPGTRVYISCTGLKNYHNGLLEKQYKYNRPGLEETFYNTWQVAVNDPFGNIILFNEEKTA